MMFNLVQKRPLLDLQMNRQTPPPTQSFSLNTRGSQHALGYQSSHIQRNINVQQQYPKKPSPAMCKVRASQGNTDNQAVAFTESQETIERLYAELELSRQEAVTVAQLKAEVDARAAAMANLQAQLEHVEALRAEELKTAVARFEELENALNLAEASMDAESLRVEALEAKVSELENDLEAASQAAEVLRGQLHGAQRAEKEAAETARAAQQNALAAQKAAQDEAAKCAQLITKAEALAAAVADRLTLINTHQTLPSLTTNTTSNTSSLSEVDAEALLDELDLLRGELEAELQVTEDESARADAAEAEADALRRQLAALASAGDDGATTMGGFSQSLVQELAAARAAASKAIAETEGLRAIVANLEAQLKSSNSTVGIFKNSSDLHARIRELEEEATHREAALAEGRAFLKSLLLKQEQNE